ncbi:MAG: hypothetical protein ACTSUC_17840 [Promethearchaeota archaeon]
MGSSYLLGFFEGALVATIIIGLGVYLSPLIYTAFQVLRKESNSE